MEYLDVNQMNIREAVVALRDMKREIKPKERLIKQLSGRIKNELVQSGERISVEGVIIKFVDVRTKQSWNNDKLLGYAIAHPEILECMNKEIIGPTVRITVDYME